MKTQFALLLSINTLACKCDNVNLKSSFESADLVFIGSVFEVYKTPSGFKALDNYLSKVKIEKITKGIITMDFTPIKLLFLAHNFALAT